MMTKPDHSTGSYVAFELSKVSQLHVDKFITETLQLANPIDPSYLHSTIIYSETPVPECEFLDRELDAEAKMVRYEIFNTKVGKKCLTAIIDCPVARELNAMLVKLGATSKFSPYSCHLTLSYDYEGDIQSLPLMPFDLYYYKLLVKPLDINFIPPSK